MSTIFYRLFFICCFIGSVIATSSRKCPPNEIEVSCIDRCQKCEYIYGGCVQIQVCEPGCDCFPGFYRNKKGECVPKFFCEEVCSGPNEVYSDCVNPCNDCTTRGNCQFLVCNKGCDCKKGYRRYQGICIPESQCPAVLCGPNSKPSDCVFCEPTCRNPKPEVCAQSVCTIGCECDPGFIKDDNGNCIPEYLCPRPQICGPNEVYSDCVNPCNDCKTRGQCQFLVCNKGCDCRKGYRRFLGICIPESQCPKGKCGKDEVYYRNKPDCKNTCENYDNPAVLCRIGDPGCFCKDGLVKRKDGKCVRPEECFPPPVVCGPNSKPSDCVFCEPTCRNSKPEACAQSCTVGCACDPGFIKDDYGNCIREDQCPLICGPNSTPSDCVYCEPSCRYPKPEVCAQACFKGCTCDPGFIKDDNGNCIPKDQCPEYCPVNEVYSDCVNICNTCELKNVTCNFLVCNKGCDCRPGYTRNERQICIPEDWCPKTCGTNEEYSECGTACQPNCYNKNPICTLECKTGCFCKKGFIREFEGGRCIPNQKCPSLDTCGKNEEYSECGTCEPNCYNKNPICTLECKTGCFCKKGFIREFEGGRCIPEQKCPLIVCGPNSKPSDCVFCEPTCRNPKPEVCAQSCTVGCACDPGFIKDDYGNCIPEDQCPIICGPNSTPSDCVYCEPTCRYPKPEVCAQACFKGCACDPGFIKDDNGNCIPKDQCPRPLVCGPNSSPGDCVFCEPTCRNPNPEVCPQSVCTIGCVCDPGFIKDDYGNCIPKYLCAGPQCSIPKCGYGCEIDYGAKPCPACKCDGDVPVTGPSSPVCPLYEIPVQCINRCQKCEYKNGGCTQTGQCTPGCDCLPGFLRNENNFCVPAALCDGGRQTPVQGVRQPTHGQFQRSSRQVTQPGQQGQPPWGTKS